MSTHGGESADLSAFSELAPELAEMLVALACDIALVIDDDGVIRNVAVGAGQADRPEVRAWVGQRWAETVTMETRRKVDELLADLDTSGLARQRQFTHASAAGIELPIAYTAVRLGERGLTLAVGRDLRLVSALQERLLEAQQSIERDYWNRRRSDTRHRVLFELADEAVLMLDAVSLQIVDANEGAADLLGLPPRRLIGVPVQDVIEPGSHGVLRQLLADVGHAQCSVQKLVQLIGAERFIGITVQPYHGGAGNVLLVRMTGTIAAAVPAAPRHEALLVELAERTCDAIAICASNGCLLHANAAFRELIGVHSGFPVEGKPLSNWLRTTHMAFPDFLQAIRSAGECALLQAHVLRRSAWPVEVEVSASLLDGGQAIGFLMRVAHDPHAVDVDVHIQQERNVH